MSRCPFGAELAQGVLQVAEALDSRVRLEVQHLGRIHEGALTSPYGEPGLHADRQRLCAQSIASTEQWHRFMLCQTAQPASVPVNGAACAQRSGIPPEALQRCVRERGDALVRKSFEASQAAGVTQSPTLYIGDERYVGGRGAPLVAREVCKAIGAPSPDYCRTLPEPLAVPVTVVADERCAEPKCATGGLLAWIHHYLPGARVKILDWADSEARELYARVHGASLPLAVFGGSLAHERTSFERLTRAGLRRLDSDDAYVFEVSSGYRPHRGHHGSAN